MKGIDFQIYGDFKGDKLFQLADIRGFATEIRRLFPAEANCAVTIRNNGGLISFSMDVLTEDGKELLLLERYITPGKVMGLELMVIDDSMQGKGIGKAIHKAQYNLSKTLKIPKYILDANLNVGGYAWFKFGMVPDSPDELVKQVGKYVKKLGVGHPDSHHFNKLYRQLTDSKDKVKFIRENLTELKPALLGTDWVGGLDFNDKESLKLYEEYIGAKKPKPVKKTKVAPSTFVERQVVLERVKATMTKDYERLIQDVDRTIAQLLATGDLTDKDLRSAVVELRKSITTLYEEQNAETMSQLRTLFGAEDVWNSEGLFSIITLDNWDLCLKSPIQATGDLLEPFVRGLSTRQIKRIESAILVGRAQGDTISQIVTRIRGTKARNYRDGVLRKGLNDARTVVRTAVQHTATRARISTWEALDIDSYRWISTLDGVTSSSCRSLDNKVFKLDQGPLPPIHPGCRSTVIPDFGDEIGTRSSLDGYVAANTSYYDWLKTRSPKFQDFAIGPTRGKLLRDGNLSTSEFADLQLDRKFEPLTLDEMRKLKPNAFEQANI